MGACVRGKVSAWRGDHAAAVRHFERAAWCADQRDWADPGVRGRLDHLLAEAYVAVGRPDDARRISAWLRELGERLHRPALTGDADRIDALVGGRGRRPRRRGGVGPGGGDRARVLARCAWSWPAACWCSARSSGGARPAGSPATRCAGRTPWPPRWVTGRCSPDRTGAAAGRRGTVRQRADRDRAAGRRPDRGRRDQPGRRGGAVRQRADHRDARRVHLPQAGRAHPRRAGPAAAAGSVVLRIPRPCRARPGAADIRTRSGFAPGPARP